MDAIFIKCARYTRILNVEYEYIPTDRKTQVDQNKDGQINTHVCGKSEKFAFRLLMVITVVMAIEKAQVN